MIIRLFYIWSWPIKASKRKRKDIIDALIYYRILQNYMLLFVKKEIIIK